MKQVKHETVKPTIVKTEDLPSTVNAWGFSGAINKKRYTMSNGDVWVEGTACYRHLSPERYIQCKFNSPDFTGGLTADIDVLLRGSAEKHITKYYNRHP